MRACMTLHVTTMATHSYLAHSCTPTTYL